MQIRPFFNLTSIVALAGLSSVVAGCNGRDVGADAAATDVPPMTVGVATVRTADLVDDLSLIGNLIATASVDVLPKIGGRLEAVHVELGDPVSRGDQLARMEDRDLQDQVRQAEAGHDVAAATVHQRETDLALADTHLKRARALFSGALIARGDLDDGEARAQTAETQLGLARAQFAQSAARLEELRGALADAILTSPIDGFVAARHLDPGAMTSPGTPILSLVDIDPVRVVAHLVERDITRVAVGQQADIEVDAFAGERFAGRVARIAPVVEPSTRTSAVEIEIPNGDGRLKPGMSTRVRLVVGHRSGALVAPRNAVVDLNSRRGVFTPTRTSDGIAATFVPVRTGSQDADLIEILDGLSDGAQVITTGAAALKDGDRVELATDPPAAADRQPNGPTTGVPGGSR